MITKVCSAIVGTAAWLSILSLVWVNLFIDLSIGQIAAAFISFIVIALFATAVYTGPKGK